MCAVDAYYKDHVSMPDDASSGIGIPMQIAPPKEALVSLSQTINFIDNSIQCFEDNYDNRIIIY